MLNCCLLCCIDFVLCSYFSFLTTVSIFRRLSWLSLSPIWDRLPMRTLWPNRQTKHLSNALLKVVDFVPAFIRFSACDFAPFHINSMVCVAKIFNTLTSLIIFLYEFKYRLALFSWSNEYRWSLDWACPFWIFYLCEYSSFFHLIFALHLPYTFLYLYFQADLNNIAKGG